MNAWAKLIKHLENNAVDSPCYLYDVNQVINNYESLKQVLGTSLIASVKANSCQDLILRTSHLMDGFEVASIQELNLIAAVSKNFFVNTPHAGEELIQATLASNGILILDNLNMLSIVEKSIGKQQIEVMIRLNSTVIEQFSDQGIRSSPDQFGMDWDTLQECIKRMNDLNIDLLGLHVFNGYYSFSKKGLLTVKAMPAIVSEVERIYGKPLAFLNLGGGFSEEWPHEEYDFSSYREALKKIPSHIQLAHESGRGIYGNAGYYITRVIHTKRIENIVYAICDGGLSHNFLLAQTENPFKKYKIPHHIKKSEIISENHEKADKIILVGPTCAKSDIISILPEGFDIPKPGDIFVFENCGAYNFSYSVSAFLSLSKAKEYLMA